MAVWERPGSQHAVDISHRYYTELKGSAHYTRDQSSSEQWGVFAARVPSSLFNCTNQQFHLRQVTSSYE